MKDVLSSPLTSFGGKYQACVEAELHKYIPILTNNKQIYVEPFCGSCVMFFNVSCRTALLNDKYNLNWNFWHVISQKSLYDQFISEMQNVWIGSAWFTEYQQRTDPVGKAIFFYLQNRSSHKGMQEDKYRYKFVNHPFEKDFSRWREKFDRLASLSVWDLDFRDVYQKLAKSESEYYTFTWYIDPPYFEEDRYSLPFTEQDHRDLAEWNHNFADNPKHQLLISYNDHPFIYELYPKEKWHIKKLSWYQGSLNRDKTELLISNRPIRKYDTTSSLMTYFGTKTEKPFTTFEESEE